MKFKYTALGASNQKLEGVLDSESLEAAREELHKLGMSVVGIKEVSTEEAAAVEAKKASQTTKDNGITSYFFVSKDLQGKEVNGTIDSKDPSSAFRRLVTEYQFDVIDLYPQDAPDPAAASLKPQFEEWKKSLEAEGIDLTSKVKSGSKNELEEEGESMNEEMVAEIDQFIINSKKIISDFADQYSEPFQAQINNTLGELERIRASNNIKHITKLCNDLYELISNPDMAKETPGNGTDEAYEQTVGRLRGSGFITNRFKFLEMHNLQKKFARFEKIQTLMAKVQKLLHRSKAKEIEKNYSAKINKRRAKWFSKVGLGKKTEDESNQVTLFTVLSKLFAYLSASNVIMRKAKKQEFLKTFRAWKKARKEPKAKKTSAKTQATSTGEQSVSDEGIQTGILKDKRSDFSNFFMEINSFLGWLLFFYLTYFFLVSFALERNVGLPQELVLKTLSSPLIVNISIFLIFAHLAFTLKIKMFRSNFLGSLFLFFFCFGAYTLLIVNF